MACCGAQAVEHIHAAESILTFGMSDTVLAFLLEASKKRDFQVAPPTLLHCSYMLHGLLAPSCLALDSRLLCLFPQQEGAT